MIYITKSNYRKFEVGEELADRKPNYHNHPECQYLNLPYREYNPDRTIAPNSGVVEMEENMATKLEDSGFLPCNLCYGSFIASADLF